MIKIKEKSGLKSKILTGGWKGIGYRVLEHDFGNSSFGFSGTIRGGE